MLLHLQNLVPLVTNYAVSAVWYKVRTYVHVCTMYNAHTMYCTGCRVDSWSLKATRLMTLAAVPTIRADLPAQGKRHAFQRPLFSL